MRTPNPIESVAPPGTPPLLGRPSLWVSVAFNVMRVLECLSSVRQRILGRKASPRSQRLPSEAHRQGSLWVFASTIGELNLIEPLLRRLLAELPGVPLTLITDRPIYLDSYRGAHPDAYVFCHAGDARDTRRLAALSPPLGGLVVEIPCLPSDAPCRLPFAVPFELRRHGVPLVLLNGWIYGYEPASGIDRLERRWFSRDYVRSFDLITVQNDEIRERLISAGADPTRVHVTGNTKFDAIGSAQPGSIAGRPSAILLDALRVGGRPVVVAGCVTDRRDQERILDAFEAILARHPDTLLVLAPRHPENLERMARLRDSLARRGHRALERRTHGDLPVPPDVRCLVLDTFGELRDFYAIASVAFVGRNHNLLEPLAHGKPVTTAGQWDGTYPSYPVYRALQSAGVVDEAENAEELAQAWAEVLAGRGTEASLDADLNGRLASLGGATERNLSLLRQVLIPRVVSGLARS